MDDVDAKRMLELAGDDRLALKIKSRRFDVERYGPDLAMQMAIFEALGYPRNGEQFRHLARRLPWPYLIRFAAKAGADASRWHGFTEDVARAEALLLWAACFGERPDFAAAPALAGEVPNWETVATRPSNRPRARMAAVARLVAEWWRHGGPLRHALKLLGAARRGSQLRDAFVIDGRILGRGRAGEIVVNAVLPTAAAWAEVGKDAALYRTVLDRYRDHPSLPSNSVLREAMRVLNERGVLISKILGARRQQSAMHVYKTMLLRPRASRQLNLECKVLSA